MRISDWSSDVCSSDLPEIVYGFGFSTGYKNFDLSCFFQGLTQESFWIDAEVTAPFVGNKQLLAAYANDHWSEQNGNVTALWPRLNSVASNNNTERSTWFMRDGSFLRLKSVEAGFSLPADRLQRLRSEELSVGK